ncbi:TetR family transcriptional regulator [Micromonospora palomenae]|uniref:TetR family transcriptional regulator n=1 Tax=Micromonospora palomenae TaxID=1461247 RepID=A0A561WW23_9ACTN|nr:TetR/AcrR family transcriptional regulator [Micromonospora palomenae]TWG28060.1 TetR family transcriptional regulator [Micromonospora palomenae]
MDADPTTRHRRRDAAATRAALLHAARSLMARHGVEGTSTRDVAAAAGVNQTLVYRYFGSKEKLFAEAACAGAESPNIVTKTPLAELPRALLDRALDLTQAEESGDLAALVGAANDEHVRAVLRDRIEKSFGALAARLDGPDADLRAELVAAILIGVGLLRHKIGTTATSTADRETLAIYVDRMMATLIRPSP